MEPCQAGWVIQLCQGSFHVGKWPYLFLRRKAASSHGSEVCRIQNRSVVPVVHLLPKFVFQFKRYSYASSYIQLGSLNPLSIWLNRWHIIVKITSFHLKVHLYFRIYNVCNPAHCKLIWLFLFHYLYNMCWMFLFQFLYTVYVNIMKLSDPL